MRSAIIFAACVALALAVMALEAKGQAITINSTDLRCVDGTSYSGDLIHGIVNHGACGMPTPVMEPPQLCAGYVWIDSAGIAHCPTQAIYISGMSHHSTQMAVPDSAEREHELQEEWEDCFDADPVMEKYPMCQKR